MNMWSQFQITICEYDSDHCQMVIRMINDAWILFFVCLFVLGDFLLFLFLFCLISFVFPVWLLLLLWFGLVLRTGHNLRINNFRKHITLIHLRQQCKEVIRCQNCGPSVPSLLLWLQKSFRWYRIYWKTKGILERRQ